MSGQSTRNLEQAFNEKEIREALDLLILNGKKISDDLKVTFKKKYSNLTEQKQLQDIYLTINYYRTEKTKIQNSLNEIKEKTTKKERREFIDKTAIISSTVNKIEKLCRNYKTKFQMKFGLKHAGKVTNYKAKGQFLFKNDEIMENTITTPEVDRTFKEINNMRKEIVKQKERAKELTKKISKHDRQSWYTMEEMKRKLDNIQEIMDNCLRRLKMLKIEIKEKKILNDYVHQRYENITASLHRAMADENRKSKINTNQLEMTLENKSMLNLQILSSVKKIEPIEFYNETKERYLHNLHAELCRRIKKVDHINQMDNQIDDHIEVKERKRKKEKKRKKNKEEQKKLKNLFLEIEKTNLIKLERNTKIDEALTEHRKKILADRFHLFEFSPYREPDIKIRNNIKLLDFYFNPVTFLS